MPTFTDMFYKSPSQEGDPHLKPEEAFTIEGGVKYNHSFLRSYLTIFRRRGYDMIDWVKYPSPDSIIWRSMNHSKINFTGIRIISMALSPPDEGPFKRIQSFRISYTFLHADPERNIMLSKYALDYLNHQVNLYIDLRIAWKLYNSILFTYHDRNSVYQDSKGQLVPYKPFWLSDAKIYWKGTNYTLFTEASNIFNSSYYDFGGIIQPGIWFRGGIVVDFDYGK